MSNSNPPPNLPNFASVSSSQIDGFFANEIHRLLAHVTANAQQQLIQNMSNTFNHTLSNFSASHDPICMFVNSRTGKRCIHPKGTKFENGRWKTLDYCLGPLTKNHYNSWLRKERERDRETTARATFEAAQRISQNLRQQSQVSEAPRRRNPEVPRRRVPEAPRRSDVEPMEMDEDGEENFLSDIDSDQEWEPERALSNAEQHQRMQEAERSILPTDNCTICLQPFGTDPSTYRAIICSHVFHHDCINTWMLVNASCPICRTSI